MKKMLKIFGVCITFGAVLTSVNAWADGDDEFSKQLAAQAIKDALNEDALNEDALNESSDTTFVNAFSTVHERDYAGGNMPVSDVARVCINTMPGDEDAIVKGCTEFLVNSINNHNALVNQSSTADQIYIARDKERCLVHNNNTEHNDGLLDNYGADMSNCAGLGVGDWRMNSERGNVKGMSRCSVTGGDFESGWKLGKIGNPSTKVGKYCWCKADEGSTWVFLYEMEPDAGRSAVWACQNSCVRDCAATAFAGTKSFLETLLGRKVDVKQQAKNEKKQEPKTEKKQDSKPVESKVEQPESSVELAYDTDEVWLARRKRDAKDPKDTGCISHNSTSKERNNGYRTDYMADEKRCEGLQVGEWRMSSKRGNVKGTSKCARNGGALGNIGTPSGNGRNCWCKAEQGTSWVFYGDEDGELSCSDSCAKDCASTAFGGSISFLEAMLK